MLGGGAVVVGLLYRRQNDVKTTLRVGLTKLKIGATDVTLRSYNGAITGPPCA